MSNRLTSGNFGVKQVFHNRSFASQDLVNELYRCRKMPVATKAAVRILKNIVNLRGVRLEYMLVDELKRLTPP